MTLKTTWINSFFWLSINFDKWITTGFILFTLFCALSLHAFSNLYTALKLNVLHEIMFGIRQDSCSFALIQKKNWYVQFTFFSWLEIYDFFMFRCWENWLWYGHQSQAEAAVSPRCGPVHHLGNTATTASGHAGGCCRSQISGVMQTPAGGEIMQNCCLSFSSNGHCKNLCNLCWNSRDVAFQWISVVWKCVCLFEKILSTHDLHEHELENYNIDFFHVSVLQHIYWNQWWVRDWGCPELPEQAVWSVVCKRWEPSCSNRHWAEGPVWE